MQSAKPRYVETALCRASEVLSDTVDMIVGTGDNLQDLWRVFLGVLSDVLNTLTLLRRHW